MGLKSSGNNMFTHGYRNEKNRFGGKSTVVLKIKRMCSDRSNNIGRT